MKSNVKITFSVIGNAIISYEENDGKKATKESPINETITVDVSVRADGKPSELGENIMEEVVRYVGNMLRNVVDDCGLMH